MKKIIAHSVYPYLFITGSWIYSQIKEMTDYDCLVVTNKKVNIDVFPYDNVFALENENLLYKGYMKFYTKAFQSFTPFVYKTLREKKVSLIHSHFGNIGWQDIKAAEKLSIPQITTFYGYDISQLARKNEWKRRYKELFKNCDLFTVEGNHMKQALVDLGCREEKIIVKHLGIDLDKVRYIPRSINEDGIIKILVAGTFREKKGIIYAVEAFAAVCKKYKNLRLTIIGDGKTPNELEIKYSIQRVIKENEIEGLVTMLGYQPYDVMLKIAELHHIFLSPSVQAADGDNEGGAPVTIIEMSAAGMPIVSTLHCDIPEVVLDGESGFLVKERSTEDLAERLAYLIENPELWVEMGLNGRKHTEEQYNIKKQTTKQIEIYRKLLS